MQLINILPTQADDNPWQVRALDPAHVAELAADIERRGLLNPPRVRRNGKVDHFQIASGHNRRDAWLKANPGQGMPAFLVELTDQQMAEEAIAENLKRADLTPIERARALRRYLDEFKVPQAEAAKLFGLASQGAVSNILRLLQLPEKVQARLGDGTLSEHVARALIPVVRLGEKRVVDIVEKSVEQPDDERGGWLEDQVQRLVRQEGRSLNGVLWKVDTWPKEPIKLDKPVGDIAELPSCKGCQYAIGHGYGAACIRPKCYELKTNIFATQEAARISKATGIPLAAGGEKTVMVYPKNGRDDYFYYMNKVRALLKNAAAKKLLRIIPQPDNKDRYDSQQILGSEVVGLATVERLAIEKLLQSKDEAKIATVKAKPSTPAQAAKAKELEEEAKDTRREERSLALRAKHDVSWLVIHAAQLIGERISISGGVLDVVLDAVNDRLSSEYDIIKAHLNAVETKFEKTTEKAHEDLGRELLALIFVGRELPEYKAQYDFDRMREEILTLATSRDLMRIGRNPTFKIKLPAGWDKPPIHKTEYNCWHCGVFAGQTRVTNADVARGWAMEWKGKQLLDVRCPACGKKK